MLRLRSMFLRRLASIALCECILASTLCGCGGSSGSNVPGGSGGSGNTITPERRMAVLEEINSKASELLKTTPGGGNQAMLDYLKTLPELKNATLSDAMCISAEFLDGRRLVVINNLAPSSSRAATPSPPRSRAAQKEAPRKGQYRIVDGFGAAFDHLTIQRVAGQLEDAGYTPAPGTDHASVYHLKEVRNDSVLVFQTHGGLGRNPLNLHPFPCLMTSTPTSLPDDATLLLAGDFDADNPRVVYVTALDRLDSSGKPVYTSHYGITPAFVEHYWSFGLDSFAYFGACSGAELGIKEACFRNGLSAFAGWTNPLRNDADTAAMRELFNGMLGRGAVAAGPTNPFPVHNRPYDWPAVLDWMHTHNNSSLGLPYDQSPPYTDPTTHTTYTAVLTISVNPNSALDDFGILRPTIAQADIDNDRGTLTLTGIFGEPTVAHTVMVGGRDMTAQSQWTPTQIVVSNIPRTGAGSSGDVYVTIQDDGNKNVRVSNTVQLTEWRGTFTHTTKGDSGTLSIVTTFNLHLRAVVNPLTKKIYGPQLIGPDGNPFTLGAVPDSTASYHASGTTPNGGLSWRDSSPPVPLVYNTAANNSGYAYATLTIDPSSDLPTLILRLRATADKAYQIVTRNSVTDAPLSVEFPRQSLAGRTIEFDENWNIQAGSWDDGVNGTLTWGTIKAVNPPDSEADRSASIRR